MSGLPWPSTIGERVRRNKFTDEWADREGELRARRDELAGAAGDRGNSFAAPPDPDTSAVLYGQSAAFVHAVRPAAEVLRTVCDDAEAILRSRPPSLLT
jgi:nitronate monooxygenase